MLSNFLWQLSLSGHLADQNCPEPRGRPNDRGATNPPGPNWFWQRTIPLASDTLHIFKSLPIN